MNISNAIRNVERVFMNFPDIASEEDIESFEIAVEAMNKQDPMKPVNDRCKCGEDVRNWTGDEAFNYCPNCGQAIDWEE